MMKPWGIAGSWPRIWSTSKKSWLAPSTRQSVWRRRRCVLLWRMDYRKCRSSTRGTWRSWNIDCRPSTRPSGTVFISPAGGSRQVQNSHAAPDWRTKITKPWSGNWRTVTQSSCIVLNSSMKFHLKNSGTSTIRSWCYLTKPWRMQNVLCLNRSKS